MDFIAVLAYALVAGLSILAGTVIVLRSHAWVARRTTFLISFAAGIMLATAFFHLIPEAGELTGRAIPLVFAGFLAFYALQQGLMFHACGEQECPEHKLGVMSSFGLTIHSALDGIAIAAGFEADWRLGFFTTMAVLMHKLPEGITISGILTHAGMPRRKVLLFSGIVAAATPLAAAVTWLFLRDITAPTVGALLALTGGSFLYLAAADLIPETHRVHHRANALFFFAGVGIVALAGRLLH